MGVLVEIGAVARRLPLVSHRFHQSARRQGIEAVVNRGQGDIGCLGAHAGKYLDRGGMIALSHLTIRIRPTPVKDTPYESGIPPLGDARERFSVKFYMVAMLFIIFDIETVFMIPWAAYFRELSCVAPPVSGACPAGSTSFFGLGEMIVFMVILLVGYLYVWKKGAFQWD